MKKRLLALVMALTLALSLLPVTAGAFGEGQHSSEVQGTLLSEEECPCFEVD